MVDQVGAFPDRLPGSVRTDLQRRPVGGQRQRREVDEPRYLAPQLLQLLRLVRFSASLDQGSVWVSPGGKRSAPTLHRRPPLLNQVCAGKMTGQVGGGEDQRVVIELLHHPSCLVSL